MFTLTEEEMSLYFQYMQKDENVILAMKVNDGLAKLEMMRKYLEIVEKQNSDQKDKDKEQKKV